LLSELVELGLEKHSPERREARRQAAESRKLTKQSLTKSQTSKIPRRPATRVRDLAMIEARGQCQFVSADGVRCTARHDLELDHVLRFALGGGNEATNIRVYCRSHHVHAAEQDFGKQYSRQSQEASAQ